MSEQQTIEDLMAWPFGIERRDAELRTQDDDLWMVDASARYGFEHEEAAQQWKEANNHLEGLVNLCQGGAFNEATAWAIQDAWDRAKEALRRSRERSSASERSSEAEAAL